MENAVARTGDKKSLAKFNPKQTTIKLGALKEAVKLATRIKDWEALSDAIDAIIAEQRAFLAWWQGHVTPGKGGDRKSEDQSFRPATLIPALIAQTETGISKVQVSRWNKRLEDELAYRSMLFDDAYLPMWALRSGVRGTTGPGGHRLIVD